MSYNSGYSGGGGGGGIGGSTGATDNAILRADGAGGSTIQSSGLLISDSGVLQPPTGSDLVLSNPAAGNNQIILRNAFSEVGMTYDDTRVLAFRAMIRYSSVTPAQITANENDYVAGTAVSYMWRLSSDAARDITGIAAPGFTGSTALAMGDARLLVNVGANNITLKHESASSTAANRLLCSTGADIVLSANQAAELIYDGTSARWRVFKRN